MDAPDRDAAKVQAMFGRVARRYRFANTVLSAGMDGGWRRRCGEIVRQWQPARVLDIATGSGDLARAIERACPSAEVTGADFSPEMLEVARKLGSTRLVQADALNLPFESGSYDVATVAFGLRNMASWERALSEMARVLRPGGHILILDFSVPPPPLRYAYRPYLHLVLPHLASLLTGEREAYRYLAESIEAFPSGERLCALIQGAGFRETECKRLSGGIVSVYTGERGE
jgi:demethylmenaquinone methyltransferase/2-methoxy-6-polyprenyl-1,4-benzoquinol methylase